MFKSSLSRKLFGLFGTFLIMFNSFAWGPWDAGQNLLKKWLPEANRKTPDPLLPYIHQSSKVTIFQFSELLNHLSAEQRKDLWKALKASEKSPNHEISSEELEKELLWQSSSWVTYPFKKRVDYHKTVQWVAKELDINDDKCKNGTTFQLERRIMEEIFAKLWDKLDQKEKQKILEGAGLEPNNAVAYSALSASVLLASAGVASSIMGFGFYIIVAKTIASAAAFLFGVNVATTIATVAMLCGPIGWTIATVSAMTGALLIGRANVMKTASFIIALHSMKAVVLAKSEIDISKYVWQENAMKN